MIASPSDVEEERIIVREVLATWNALHSTAQRVVFLPLGWETHSSPDLGGRPQQLINDRILGRCDLLVGIFWTRIGSPTGKAISGTVEEIHEHHAAGKPVMLYFADRPVPPDRLDSVQYGEVQNLRRWAYEEGIVGGYDNLSDFRAQLERHLHIMLQQNAYLRNHTEIGIISTYGAALGHPLDGLSSSAEEMLKVAANSQDGMILVRRFIGGTTVQAGQKSFVNEDSGKREVARWVAAAEEIHDRGYA